MAVDFLTGLMAFGLLGGLVCSGYILYLIVFVQREDYPMPALFLFGSVIITVNWFVGFAWDQDPAQFPPAYCKASSILYNFGAFTLTSTGCTLTLTTWNALSAARQGRFEHICRPWQVPKFLLPFFLLYPFGGVAVFAALALTQDAIGPEGLWICDIVKPDKMWIRLFGYGGLDVLVTIPAATASLFSIYNLWCIHHTSSITTQLETYQRTHHGVHNEDDEDDDTFALRRVDGNSLPPNLPTPRTSPLISTNFDPAQTLHITASGDYDMRFRETPQIREVLLTPSDNRKSGASTWRTERASTEMGASSFDHGDAHRVWTETIPNDALPSWRIHPKSHTTTMDSLPDPYHGPEHDYVVQEHEPMPVIHDAPSMTKVDSSGFDAMPSHATTWEGPTLENGGTSSTQPIGFKFPEPVKPKPKSRRRRLIAVRHQPQLLRAMWRILFFDVIFTGIEVLAAITSLHAVVTREAPKGYSTAFVAVTIGIWGPTIIFGSTPVILDHIAPWWRTVARWVGFGRKSHRH